MDELEQRILSVLGGRALRSAMEALQAKLISSQVAPAPAPAAPGNSSAAAGDLEQMVETKLVTIPLTHSHAVRTWT